MEINFQSFFDCKNINHENIMYLSIFIDDESDPNLKQMYIQSAAAHNKKLFEEPQFYDAGFDLFLPKNDCNKGTSFFKDALINKVNFKLKCCSKMFHLSNTEDYYYTPF